MLTSMAVAMPAILRGELQYGANAIRMLLYSVAAGFLAASLTTATLAQGTQPAALDVTFVFTNDIHTCRMGEGLSPNCQQEGKTDAALLRHIAGINGVAGYRWPREIDGEATGLQGGGTPIVPPLGVVVGGDMTDDGGGQVALPHEGTPTHPVQSALSAGKRSGPHPLSRLHRAWQPRPRSGRPARRNADWYRRELRDYVELNHRSSVFFKAPVPVDELRRGQ